MRNRNTLEFIEDGKTNIPEFKGVEFDTFKKEAGLNSFRLAPKNELRKPMPSAFNLGRAGILAALMRIKISPLSLALGTIPFCIRE